MARSWRRTADADLRSQQKEDDRDGDQEDGRLLGQDGEAGGEGRAVQPARLPGPSESGKQVDTQQE